MSIHKIKFDSVDDLQAGPKPSDPLQNPFEALDKLYNIGTIKKKLEELKTVATVAKKEGEEIPSIGHFVFLGSPGTGKTTVARTIAEILFQLELISTNTIVQTSALDLTGDYLGQTKNKSDKTT